MNASYLENFQIDVVKYARVTVPRTKRIKRVDTSSPAGTLRWNNVGI